MKLELMKEFTFEASHILPRHPGKCSRLHGHSWKLRVHVKGEPNEETGFVMDYTDIKLVVQSLVDKLDHRHLGTWGSYPIQNLMLVGSMKDRENSVAGLPDNFYPSSENLIVWIASEMNRMLHDLWYKVELDETCTSSCILTREEYERR